MDCWISLQSSYCNKRRVSSFPCVLTAFPTKVSACCWQQPKSSWGSVWKGESNNLEYLKRCSQKHRDFHKGVISLAYWSMNGAVHWQTRLNNITNLNHVLMVRQWLPAAMSKPCCLLRALLAERRRSFVREGICFFLFRKHLMCCCKETHLLTRN